MYERVLSLLVWAARKEKQVVTAILSHLHQQLGGSIKWIARTLSQYGGVQFTIFANAGICSFKLCSHTNNLSVHYFFCFHNFQTFTILQHILLRSFKRSRASILQQKYMVWIHQNSLPCHANGKSQWSWCAVGWNYNTHCIQFLV